MIYELRHYIPVDGRQPELLARFRDHSIALLRKHNFKIAGFWVAKSDGHIWYMLEWPDKQTRSAAWKRFGEDPEWRTLSHETEKNGAMVERVDTVLLEKPFELEKL